MKLTLAKINKFLHVFSLLGINTCFVHVLGFRWSVAELPQPRPSNNLITQKQWNEIFVEVSGVEPLSLEIANLTVHTVCFIRYIFGLSFEKSHLKRGADWIVSSSTSYLRHSCHFARILFTSPLAARTYAAALRATVRWVMETTFAVLPFIVVAYKDASIRESDPRLLNQMPLYPRFRSLNWGRTSVSQADFYVMLLSATHYITRSCHWATRETK